MLFKPKAQALFFLARKAGLAYLQMPKAACTSFKVALALLKHPELRDEIYLRPTSIHKKPEWNDMVGADDPVLPDLFRFTFVRHPVSRFLSFYQKKVLQPPRGSVLPEIACCGFRLGMSLIEAIRVVERTPARKLDPHVAPQSWLVFHRGKPRVNFIGHIERMAEDLGHLADQCGVRLDLDNLNRSSSKERPELTPTEEEWARIVRIYAEDFGRFGYAKDVVPVAAGSLPDGAVLSCESSVGTGMAHPERFQRPAASGGLCGPECHRIL